MGIYGLSLKRNKVYNEFSNLNLIKSVKEPINEKKTRRLEDFICYIIRSIQSFLIETACCFENNSPEFLIVGDR